MASKTIRTILALDGEQQFRRKLTQINSELGVMKANMKQLTAEYDTSGKKVKILKNQKSELENRIKTLKDKSNVLKDAIKSTNEAYERASAEHNKAILEHGEESNEAKRLEKALLQLQQRENGYRTQLANTNTELLNAQRDFRDVNTQIRQQTGLTKDAREKISSFNKALAKLELKGLKEGFKLINEEVKVAVKGFEMYTKAVGAAAAGITAFAVKSGADFEEGMSTVQALSGATGDSMDLLKEKALSLGASTKFTAKEVSDGFSYMGMAGWNAAEMLGGIDGVINLAAASGEDLGLVSDIVTDSLTAFGMEASDASRYADILAQASTNANTNVAMMGETFQYCAPIAGAMGYKVDDLATAIGVMANAGIKGSMAGTSLRSIMTNLSAPTDASAAAMEKLGISITDEAGNMKPFAEVVSQLREGFAGLSEAEQAAAAKAIAGKPGMSGLLAIVNTSEEDFNDLSKAVGNCYGAAKEMADVKLDNLNGDVTYLKSATEGLGNTLYDLMNNKLRSGVQAVTMLVTKLNDGIRFGRDMTKVFKDISTNVNILVERALKQLVNNLPTFLKGFNTIFIGIIDQLIDMLPELVNRLLPRLVTGFTTLVNQLVQRLPEVIPVLVQGAKRLLTQLVTELDIVNTGIEIAMELIRGLVAVLPDLLSTGAELLMQLINGIVDNLPELITTAIDIVLMIVDTILENLDTLLEASLRIIIALAEGLVECLDKILPYIPKIVKAIVKALIENLPLLIQAALEIMLALGEGLVDSIDVMVEMIPEIADAIIETFLETDWADVGHRILEGIANGLSNIGAGIRNKFNSAVDAVKSFFTNGFDIHSPSKWAANVIGKNIVLGQAKGIEDTAEHENQNMFSSLSKFGGLVTSKASDFAYAPAGAEGVTVNLYGNVTLNDTDKDLDGFITDIETRIRDRKLGRGR